MIRKQFNPKRIDFDTSRQQKENETLKTSWKDKLKSGSKGIVNWLAKDASMLKMSETPYRIDDQLTPEDFNTTGADSHRYVCKLC